MGRFLTVMDLKINQLTTATTKNNKTRVCPRLKLISWVQAMNREKKERK